MGNFLKYCLLYTAAFLLLLHSFVPHQHHRQTSSELTFSACVHNENTLIGFLAQAFHLDLGQEHLEDFKPTPRVDLDISLPMMPNSMVPEVPQLLSVLEEKYPIPVVIFLPKPFFGHQIPLRGPPTSKPITVQHT